MIESGVLSDRLRWRVTCELCERVAHDTLPQHIKRDRTESRDDSHQRRQGNPLAKRMQLKCIKDSADNVHGSDQSKWANGRGNADDITAGMTILV